jgi:hypothetical protein
MPATIKMNILNSNSNSNFKQMMMVAAAASASQNNNNNNNNKRSPMLSGPMIKRVHGVQPGCGSCGRSH